MKSKTGKILMLTGTVMILAAAALILWNRQDDKRAGQKAQEILEKLQQDETDVIEDTPSMAEGMPIAKVDGQEYIGKLSIPALNLDLPVMLDWSYEHLRMAPCRQIGSAEDGNFVIAGHNYRHHFGNLNKLTLGDQILFTDMDGKTDVYTVGSVEQIRAEENEKMFESEWDLTLYTCTYNGKERVTIRANR